MVRLFFVSLVATLLINGTARVVNAETLTNPPVPSQTSNDCDPHRGSGR